LMNQLYCSDKLQLLREHTTRYLGTMKFLAAVTLIALASTGSATDTKETMCVKQKDGTYKCSASGKIEKVPCCDTPTNEIIPAPRSKKRSRPAR